MIEQGLSGQPPPPLPCHEVTSFILQKPLCRKVPLNSRKRQELALPMAKFRSRLHPLVIVYDLGSTPSLSEPQLSHLCAGDNGTALGCWEDWMAENAQWDVPGVSRRMGIRCSNSSSDLLLTSSHSDVLSRAVWGHMLIYHFIHSLFHSLRGHYWAPIVYAV